MLTNQSPVCFYVTVWPLNSYLVKFDGVKCHCRVEYCVTPLRSTKIPLDTAIYINLFLLDHLAPDMIMRYPPWM